MPRVTDTILPAGTAFNRYAFAPMVDLTNGGQMGHLPDYAGYLGNTPYVKRNLVAVVIEFPRGFNDMEDPEKMRETFKALIELHPKSIEGFSTQMQVENREIMFGGAGEIHEAPGDVKRNRAAPSFGYDDKYGRPIARFYEHWITELIMDPETKYPNVVTRGTVQIADLLPDYIGATILFFEPDPTFRKIDKAYLCTNMWPKSAPPVEASRDITQGGDVSSFNIEYTSITQQGRGVVTFAQRVLDSINLTGTNPNLRPAFIDKITADVTALTDTGYAEALALAGRQAITP